LSIWLDTIQLDDSDFIFVLFANYRLKTEFSLNPPWFRRSLKPKPKLDA
jgi:hypothetical protein